MKCVKPYVTTWNPILTILALLPPSKFAWSHSYTLQERRHNKLSFGITTWSMSLSNFSHSKTARQTPSPPPLDSNIFKMVSSIYSSFTTLASGSWVFQVCSFCCSFFWMYILASLITSLHVVLQFVLLQQLWALATKLCWKYVKFKLGTTKWNGLSNSVSPKVDVMVNRKLLCDVSCICVSSSPWMFYSFVQCCGNCWRIFSLRMEFTQINYTGVHGKGCTAFTNSSSSMPNMSQKY